MASNFLRKGLMLLLAAGTACLPVAARAGRDLSLAGLMEATSEKAPAGIDFKVEGVVRAVGTGGRFIVLDDGISSELLELLSYPPGTQPGDRLVIRGEKSSVSRGQVGIRVGSTPVVDLDGLHPPATQSGSVFLA